MIRISVDSRSLDAALARLQNRVADLSPLMRQIAGIMHDAVEENFEREGRPRWESLAPSTVRQRRRKGYWPGRILQQRGELAASIEPGANSRQAWVGTNRRYAAIQHFGGKAGRGHKVTIPARPFMVLDADDLARIEAAVTRFLAGK